MKAVITNSKLGKTVVFNDVLDEGYCDNKEDRQYGTYKLKIVPDTDDPYPVFKLKDKLNFTIEKIDIFNMVKNENGEFEEVLVRSVTDKTSMIEITERTDSDLSKSTILNHKTDKFGLVHVVYVLFK